MAIANGLAITCEDLQAVGGTRLLAIRAWQGDDAVVYDNSDHTITSILDTGGSTATWGVYESRIESSSLNITGTGEGKDVLTYECAVTFFLPKMTAEQFERLVEMRDNCLMVAIVTNNDRTTSDTAIPTAFDHNKIIGVSERFQNLDDPNRNQTYCRLTSVEGGTGAAPLTFSDHVSLPFKVGFKRVYRIFQDQGLINDITFIGSGKLGFPDRAATAFAMGCDMINVAREAMLSIGCIQAQKCHTDHCPTGVATQNKYLQRGLNINNKASRFSEYIKGLRKELLQLSHACGYTHPCQFTGKDIYPDTRLGESLHFKLQHRNRTLSYYSYNLGFSSIDHFILVRQLSAAVADMKHRFSQDKNTN